MGLLSTVALERITPACAGKRQINADTGKWQTDHPRVCGEKVDCIPRSLRRKGSPPRVRGKGPVPRSSRGLGRITPACAGKSLRRGAVLGSAVRITPACAGKRGVLAILGAATGDHPRVCGEKGAVCPCRYSRAGSPPRVRGKEALTPGKRTPERITPACAGKRISRSRSSAIRRDHPRVCGEKHLREVLGVKHRGSPPRVRGKVSTQPVDVAQTRITPACAGKSRAQGRDL